MEKLKKILKARETCEVRWDKEQPMTFMCGKCSLFTNIFIKPIMSLLRTNAF